MKEPKGSKLDMKKRAEYQSEVARGEDWDISAWPKWVVTGRVLPERCDVRIAPIFVQGRGALGRFQLRIEVDRSHIVVGCALEKGNASVFEIADVVRNVLWFPLDYIAFLNRGAYEIVLDLCLNSQTGEALVIPVFEPTFEAEDTGLCFDAKTDKSNMSIPYREAGAVPELATALHDLTAAVRYSSRTFEYCRMAAEAVRRHFDPSTKKGHAERWREGEEAMCAALHLTRKSLKALDAVAARSRHGELVFSMDWEMRKRALEFAWELVARFRDHLQGTSYDQWKLLDVRFED